MLAVVQQKYGDKLQVMGAAYAEDSAQRMPEFLATIKPGYPVGIVTRGAVLRWLDVGVDDGSQVPRLVLLDRKGSMQGNFGWRHAMFQNPKTEAQEIDAAVARVVRGTQK